MKLLVTGGDGFLGLNVKEQALEMGYEFVSYDYTSGHDIRDKDMFDNFVAKHKPDMCVHLAAIANLNIYDDDVKEGHDINVVGTANVLDVCEKYNVKVIFGSTCCCYGDNKLKFSTEDSLVVPTEPYSKSKRTSELEIFERNKKLDNKHIIIRLATFYGSQHCRRALAKALFMEKVHKGEVITVHGNGNQTRTYTHVHDIASAILCLVTNKDTLKHEIYNTTITEPVSVLDIVRESQKNVGKPALVEFVEDRSSQFVQGVIDNSRLKELGWKPKYNFVDGMAELYNSFKSNGYQWTK